MKRLALNATKENIYNTFIENKLKRNSDVASFCNILTQIDDGFSIAIDGPWGSGKTFFVQHVKLVLDYFSNQLSEEDYNKIKPVLFKETNFNKLDSYTCQTVYFNAWEKDSGENPISALAYELCLLGNGIPDFYTNIQLILNGLFKRTTGTSSSDFLDKIKLLEEEKEFYDTKHYISKLIDELVATRTNRIIFFIDELDRCKPDYAVKVLESIKHYFDDERIIFVFSINASQLQHSIKAHYGEGFNATGYLDKFFDLWISLPKIDTSVFVNGSFLDDYGFLQDLSLHVINAFHFSLRETEKFTVTLKPLISTIYTRCSNSTYHSAAFSCLAYGFFAITLLGYRIKNIDEYHQITNGNGLNLIVEISHNKAIKENLKSILSITDENDYDLTISQSYHLIFGDISNINHSAISLPTIKILPYGTKDLKNKIIELLNLKPIELL